MVDMRLELPWNAKSIEDGEGTPATQDGPAFYALVADCRCNGMTWWKGEIVAGIYENDRAAYLGLSRHLERYRQFLEVEEIHCTITKNAKGFEHWSCRFTVGGSDE